MTGSIWQLYIMGAHAEGIGYFRIGIAQRVDRKYLELRASCPLTIETIWTVNCWTYRVARAVELELQKRLADLRNPGGWYVLGLDDDPARLRFNNSIRETLDEVHGDRWRLRKIETAAAT